MRMPITVVSIEDEEEITELLSVVLSTPELKVVASNTAFEGLELVKKLRPALVIMDILLPDMDGWSVYDSIRADPLLRNTPIMILSGLRREFQIRRKFHTGPLDIYLTKPFDTLQLRGRIELMVGQRLW
jgi:two-component system, OmpR family, response regulator VicR